MYIIVIYRQPCVYTYLGTPYTTPQGGEFTVLGQGDTIVFRG